MDRDALRGSDAMFYFSFPPGPGPARGREGGGSGSQAGEGRAETEQGTGQEEADKATVWGERWAGAGRRAGRFVQPCRRRCPLQKRLCRRRPAGQAAGCSGKLAGLLAAVLPIISFMPGSPAWVSYTHLCPLQVRCPAATSSTAAFAGQWRMPNSRLARASLPNT